MTDVFVAACLLALTISYLLVRANPRDAPPVLLEQRAELVLARVLGGAGIVGCIILLVDSDATISASYLLENLGAIRSANFDDLEDPVAGSSWRLWARSWRRGSVLSVITAAHYGRKQRTLLTLGIATFS